MSQATTTRQPSEAIETERATKPVTWRDGFNSYTTELSDEVLRVTGEMPAWLTGSLLRTGPSLFDLQGKTVGHWFDGLAMLHSWAFDRGRVTYSSKMLESRDYLAAKAAGEFTMDGFATDPCRNIFGRMMTLFRPGISDNGAVTVTRLGDEFLAMTETPMPVQFDPKTLETMNINHRAKAPGHVSTAHAHLDRASGGMLNYAVKIGRKSEHRFYTVDPTGDPKIIAKVGSEPPAYVHSFARTESYIVLVLGPLLMNPIKLATAGLRGDTFIDSFDWRPDEGTRVVVIDRESGALVREFKAPALFMFHEVNAFEDGDDVVIDISAYDDAAVIDRFYMQTIRNEEAAFPHAELRRLTLGMKTGELSQRTIWDGWFELPRINYKAASGRPYRYAYAVSATEDDGGSASGEDPYGFWDALVKVDVDTGAAQIWAEPGLIPAEPVFVARPGSSAEDDGVLLSIALDTDAGHSTLIVLDAQTMTRVARAELPAVLPFHFHSYHYGDLK